MNGKMLAMLTSLAALSTPADVEAAPPLPTLIDRPDYRATLAADGTLVSLRIAGIEFLARGRGIPGGGYLCAPGAGSPSLAPLRVLGEGGFQGSNALARLAYRFEERRIVIEIDAVATPCVFYLLLDPAVGEVHHQLGANGVPTIAATPATATCDRSRWLHGAALLDITGGDRIWGPYQGFQVWQLALTPGCAATVELRPGRAAAAAAAAAERPPSDAPLFTTAGAARPPQIPLCMIGDSITWAGDGDYWRRFLLDEIPSLAFVGTHTALLGYSHAGEGGNGTGAVLARLGDLPACPYYSLLIGTNDNGVRDAAKQEETAAQTAERIRRILLGLLRKSGVQRIFLCSILPCRTDNPLRDETNARVNELLRADIRAQRLSDKVVWVELDQPLRADPDWPEKIPLHPNVAGYRDIARLHAAAIREALQLTPATPPPQAQPGAGVRVVNLWDAEAGRSRQPLIAGWYTLSGELLEVTGDAPAILLAGTDGSLPSPLAKTLPLPTAERTPGRRVTFHFFTDYEGYGYSRAPLTLTSTNCRLGRILLEKQRPSRQASVFGAGVYLDTITPPAPGELLERSLAEPAH